MASHGKAGERFLLSDEEHQHAEEGGFEDGLHLSSSSTSTPQSACAGSAVRAAAAATVMSSLLGALLLYSSVLSTSSRQSAAVSTGDSLLAVENGTLELFNQAGFCQDTPGWSNGYAGCAYSKHGKDPTLCAVRPGSSWPDTTGFTCKFYQMKLCVNGDYKDYSMGVGLNSPEKNCCACSGYKPELSCNRNTEGSCRWTSYCNAWRGPTNCENGMCTCKPGYCTDSIGTCVQDARSQHLTMLAREANGIVTASPDEDQCARETDGGCFLGIGCEGWRGAVDCKGTSCTCMPGYCTDANGMCYKDMGMIKAEVWPVNWIDPHFPGEQIVTALCASGGGSRALSTMLGTYRALRDLGLIQKIDMISSVSGGSWASSIMMFAKQDLMRLLGPATDPSQLTLAELDKTPAPLGAVVTAKTNNIALKLKLQGVPFALLWVATVAEAFLMPFELDRFDSFMALDPQSVKSIKSENPEYSGALFYTPQPGRAKNIVIGSTVLAPDQYKASAENVVYLHAGPDFTGSPFYPDNKQVAYQNNNIVKPPLERVLIGGGLVQTFAFGSSAPAKRMDQGGGKAVRMRSPPRPFSLARAVGMSSAAFGGQIANLPGMGGFVNPQVDMWPVTNPEHPKPQRSMRYMIGDGGNLENTGILAMLQRKAKKIAGFINGAEPFSTLVNYCEAAGYTPTGKELSGQFSNFFGYAKTLDTSQQEFHEYNQVFKSSEYVPILCEFYKLQAAGKPLVLRKTLEVIPNEWWGIGGGWNVDIVFAILSKSTAFEKLLPEDTQKAIAEGPMGGLNGFPGFKTMFMNPPDLTEYTPRQINLLAAQAEWAVHQNADLFRAVLSG